MPVWQTAALDELKCLSSTQNVSGAHMHTQTQLEKNQIIRLHCQVNIAQESHYILCTTSEELLSTLSTTTLMLPCLLSCPKPTPSGSFPPSILGN